MENMNLKRIESSNMIKLKIKMLMKFVERERADCRGLDFLETIGDEFFYRRSDNNQVGRAPPYSPC